MGDRISIQFVNAHDRRDKSPILFSHWDGVTLIEDLTTYLNDLLDSIKVETSRYPLDRLEPSTVMVDYIRHLTADLERVTCNYYLCSSLREGDNSDNGHYIILLNSNTKTYEIVHKK